MPQTLSLNGDWSLSWHDEFPQFLTAETAPFRAQLTAQIPEPVHATLMRHGLLQDPRVGMNSLSARWVEEQYWVYRKTFSSPALQEGHAFLTFTLLEFDAVVYLNGQEIGKHASAHVPARFDVTNKLRPEGEENVLVVRIDAGLYNVAEKPAKDYQASSQASLSKIHWMRRGQWQRGWDWQQRLLNIGILGDVTLEWSRAPFLVQSQIYATVQDDLCQATVTVKAKVFNPESEPVQASLRVGVHNTDALDFSHPLLPPGESIQLVETIIDNPTLWWPVGHGDPHLYTVELIFSASSDNAGAYEPIRQQIGIRKVEIDQSPHPEVGKHFILKINNKPIFCKGGNWVPPDMLYSTVTAEHITELVDLALGANFNLLRIWGGGTWAGHELLRQCDEKGVLVWHDLLFACSKYPGDYPEWARQVRDEVRWGMREFAHHPSLVVWCGNNEIEEGDWEWGYDNHYRTHPHYALFHHDFPMIASQEAPHVFYWISSPYSPDYKRPNDPTVGDQHPWGVSLRQNGPTDWWVYRDYVDRFPNEGGVLGASTPATLREFLPTDQCYINSPAWDHHDNPYAMQPMTPGQPGRMCQTIAHWTGLNPATLDWETWAFASSLLQAEGITEYITNYRRRMFSSAAAIFWMYNDSWPTTHSWTIVDYYRRKKLAYHPVRRAFQPVTVACAKEADGSYSAYCVNETNTYWSGRIYFGVLNAEGAPLHQRYDIGIKPNSVHRIRCRFPKRLLKDAYGIYAYLRDNETAYVAQHRLLFKRFHELNLDPDFTLSIQNGYAVGVPNPEQWVTLVSDEFVWGVCLDINGEEEVIDNCFDLLPGVPYHVPWDVEKLGEPEILRTGNELFRKPTPEA
ncbi:MAG: hypothetical protein QM758_24750 [Armatimonas sp.]